MVRIITGQWTKEGCQVHFVAGLSKREALKVADNIFLSANIFGNSDRRQTVAFTIPILYLGEKYRFGRIYFKFSPLKGDEINKELSFSPEFLFCSYPELTTTKSLTILKIDTLTWQYLKLDTDNQENFNKYCNNIIDIIKHRKPIL